ncbi:MAG: alanine--tRNA ligase [Lachnospiraceae bacterium]|jgi:alanyl-tRNA synthetase|nr:alanine--tRNA ligase [Lachnospiraceae bacterium]
MTYGVNELRKMFLEFFESKGHLAMKSFSLVPHNDNSLLLINSGMAPLKPYFTGQEIPPCRRVTTCQKCIRTGDIENIGKTARHGTFFEMLGNFSFGDYFKRESLEWSWEFLTEVAGLDSGRLYPSIYLDDEEAFAIWNEVIGIPKERIFRFGKADNFWEHGAGPCGPCSEIYYDRGEKYGCGKPTCTVGCECDRYIEVWNNVFTQFESDGKGNYTELAQKNIDTGMGLERLAVVVQDVDSLFTIDTNKALLDEVCALAHTKYLADGKKDVSLRIIADHVKSCTFMVSDGIMPSNEGRGYVLRRLLRRAARHGRILGIPGKFLQGLCETVIALSKDGYPELEEKRPMILRVLSEEEDKFNRTIDTGLGILAQMEERLTAGGQGVPTLSGEDAFKLYDTYGFPLDLTREILEEKGMTVDEEGFAASMKRQRETARGARKATNYMGADVTVYQSIDPNLTTEFVGYRELEATSAITVMANGESLTEALTDGEEGTIFVGQTPFYATMGGQQADQGWILADSGGAAGDPGRGGAGVFEVKDTIALQGGKVGHVGVVKSGMFTVGQEVVLRVDPGRRMATAKNHSATHLLQKALRTVLGDHVEQAGSYVDEHRLRFDFTHFSAMTQEQLAKVQEMVNREIRADLPVVISEMTMEEAKKTGAMALFGEKYGDRVRVVRMGDFSVELCGGTHVNHTGEIGYFQILAESGIAAGVRRIEALTGDGLMDHLRGEEALLLQAARQLKTQAADVPGRIAALQEELKSLQSENEKLKAKLAGQSAEDALSKVRDVCGVSVLALRVADADSETLRALGDRLKEKLELGRGDGTGKPDGTGEDGKPGKTGEGHRPDMTGEDGKSGKSGDGVVVLASDAGGKVSLLVMVTDGAQARGAHAGNLVKELAKCVGGGGGGKANMAQAGGKDPSGIGKALDSVPGLVEAQLRG